MEALSSVYRLHAIFYLIKPINNAPLLPLPACNESDRVYLQIGESIHGVPTGTNQAFIGFCRLCLHFAAMHLDRSNDGDQLQFALTRFNKILAIQNELPKIVQDGKMEILIFK